MTTGYRVPQVAAMKNLGLDSASLMALREPVDQDAALLEQPGRVVHRAPDDRRRAARGRQHDTGHYELCLNSPLMGQPGRFPA